jgi:hypothetical protein
MWKLPRFEGSYPPYFTQPQSSEVATKAPACVGRRERTGPAEAAGPMRANAPRCRQIAFFAWRSMRPTTRPGPRESTEEGMAGQLSR